MAQNGIVNNNAVLKKQKFILCSGFYFTGCNFFPVDYRGIATFIECTDSCPIVILNQNYTSITK